MNDESDITLTITKISCMISFFIMIIIFGWIPLKMKVFQSNKQIIAFTSAFSGGLFLSVGLCHLLPEANEKFESSFEDEQDHYPFAYLITILSFALILFIEKIATDSHSHHDHHDVQNEENKRLLVGGQVNEKSLQTLQQDEDPEQQFRESVNTKVAVAKKISFVQMVKKSMVEDPSSSIIFQEVNTWAPYILQIAVGIHAVFEGLSIGIQQNTSLCVGVAVAVACHKWAEGFTLGSAFRQAGVNKRTAIIMIVIQACFNPVGIMIGWLLSDQGDLITGIFLSISVGTFLYISTLEILVEEFNISRYKWWKFLVFLIAIGFVSSFWFVEQAFGGD
ncbi:hypothetical protein pb186bvf_009569 [Paramecium bursaria]